MIAKLQKTLISRNASTPPVWFMRQAGRYHQHYQQLRRSHSFLDICKKPTVSCEAALGPVRDFDFDAAILFSDILFFLEAGGMPLAFTEKGPQFAHLLTSDRRFKDFIEVFQTDGPIRIASKLAYQYEALEMLRKQLPEEKSLIGFAGGPLTLFFYALCGSHKNDLSLAFTALTDARLEIFMSAITDAYVENLSSQAKAGADVLAILDTATGNISPALFCETYFPFLKIFIEKLAARSKVPIIYYTKQNNALALRAISKLPVACIGICSAMDIQTAFKETPASVCVQGNFSEEKMLLPEAELKIELKKFFELILQTNSKERWVCGLGHGVLPKTPENNVRLFFSEFKKYFWGDAREG